MIFSPISVSPGIAARVARPMPPLPDGLEDAVEAAWRAALARGKLFNGPVFSADFITSEAISGHVTEFRRLIAQAAGIDLGPATARPLAVVGVVVCPDGVVLGRRPPGAATFPGQWQTPPAGSVDAHAIGHDGTVDLAGALHAELLEELGLPGTAIRSARPLCLVEHRGSRIVDLATLLQTDLSAAALHAAHASGGDAEYAAISVVAARDLTQFLHSAPGGVVPSTAVFLHAAGLLASPTLPGRVPG